MTEIVNSESETDNDGMVQQALDFLFNRIEEQASRLGVTLGEDARYYLEAPSFSQGPTAHTIYFMPVPRNRDFEEFLELGKKAYSFDSGASSELDREWKRSYAVMRLNDQQSTAGFLKAVGVRVTDSFKDGLLLFIAGVLVVISSLGIGIEGILGRWMFPFQIVVAFCGASALLVFLKSRGVSKRYWKSKVDQLSRHFDNDR